MRECSAAKSERNNKGKLGAATKLNIEENYTRVAGKVLRLTSV